ncbi:MAG: NAD(P)/FAD-dependent oxidoreductase [Myxococcales bacterium]|nr:MAG: NAD(P)/FAD-dependent oxidoreductase [Myxococcales bacterium]
MSQKTVAIVGAGLAGLSAACFAALNGFKVQVFEHHTVPGGVAAAWKRKGFVFDGGVHFLMGAQSDSSLYPLYRTLGIIDGTKLLPLTHYGTYRDEETGRTIELTRDLDRFLDDVKRHSPEDAPLAAELVAGGKRFAKVDLMRGMVLGDGGGPVAKLRMLWDMRGVFRYMGGKYRTSLGEYGAHCKDPWIGHVVANIFFPPVPLWFGMMLLGQIAGGQLAHFGDGSAEFARSIERRAKHLGAAFAYRSKVERILVENGRAVGVRLYDGREVRADYVVSTADGRETIFDLLQGKYLDAQTAERYETWPLIRPIVVCSYGVNAPYRDAPWLTILRLRKPIQTGEWKAGEMTVRAFPYAPHFAPEGKASIVAAVESEWSHWRKLREDPPAYEAEKARLSGEVLARLGSVFPGVAGKVELRDVATPYTWWRYTFNREGAYEGWFPTTDAIESKIEQTLPGLSNFFMAGQWVRPGGGIPPVLLSGRDAVIKLCRTERQMFRTEPSA